MFKLIVTFILTLSYAFGQVGNLTVVAVGDAELEKDILKFSFSNELESNKDSQKLYQIVLDDFSFYKHLFKIDNDIEKDKAKYLIDLSITKDEKISYKVFDVKLKKDLGSEVLDFKYTNIRNFSHDISDRIYQQMTNKKSIFKSKILFITDKHSRKDKLIKEIYIMDFDGAQKQRITRLNSMVISPSLSHDNSKVLFTLIEAKWIKGRNDRPTKVKNLNLYMLDLNTKKRKLISNLNGINSGAIFNKSGDSIYVTLSNLKNADIYKMNLKTGQKRRITNHFLDDVDPHINADETLMTFLSGRTGKAMIYTMNPSSLEKDVKRISYVGRFNAAPRFNPKGTEIVFSSWVDNRFDIYRIDSNGTNIRRLTKNFGSNEEPWFSPDGEFIVFSSQRVISQKKAVQDLYIMNRDGEIIKKISENFGKLYTPRWSN